MNNALWYILGTQCRDIVAMRTTRELIACIGEYMHFKVEKDSVLMYIFDT